MGRHSWRRTLASSNIKANSIVTPTTNPPSQDAPRLVSGRPIILAIFGFALVASVGAWWYYRVLQREALAFWGAENAVLIASAPRAELLLLREPLPAEATPVAASARTRDSAWLELAGSRFEIVDEAEISDYPGFIHLRQALLLSRAFVGPPTPAPPNTPWRYAIRFSEGDREVTIGFAFQEEAALAVSPSGETRKLAPELGKILKTDLEGPFVAAGVEAP